MDEEQVCDLAARLNGRLSCARDRIINLEQRFNKLNIRAHVEIKSERYALAYYAAVNDGTGDHRFYLAGHTIEHLTTDGVIELTRLLPEILEGIYRALEEQYQRFTAFEVPKLPT